MPTKEQQGEKPPEAKLRKKTYKELVWEAVGVGLSASGEGALISNPETLGAGLDPEAAKAELIARLEKRIAKLAGKAIRMGSREEMDDLKQKGIEALLRGLHYFARNWNGTPARFYTYISMWVKNGVFERDFLWEKTVSLETWHEGAGGPVHMQLNQADEQRNEEGGDIESLTPGHDTVKPKDPPEAFVCVDIKRKLCPDPFTSAELSLLWKKVALLPRPQRIVLMLRYKEDLGLEATGERMGGITKQAVAQFEAKAIRRLRTMLNGEGS
jgi:RNA polymerase sigma factor (sigma-70 family)